MKQQYLSVNCRADNDLCGLISRRWCQHFLRKQSLQLRHHAAVGCGVLCQMSIYIDSAFHWGFFFPPMRITHSSRWKRPGCHEMPANVIVIGDRSAETHHKLLYLITDRGDRTGSGRAVLQNRRKTGWALNEALTASMKCLALNGEGN